MDGRKEIMVTVIHDDFPDFKEKITPCDKLNLVIKYNFSTVIKYDFNPVLKNTFPKTLSYSRPGYTMAGKRHMSADEIYNELGLTTEKILESMDEIEKRPWMREANKALCEFVIPKKA